jgi:predicted outer membrane repeat protein
MTPWNEACFLLPKVEPPMKFSLKYLLNSLFGATAPTSPIVKNRARPLVEILEDRVVPVSVGPQTFTVTTFLDYNAPHVGFVSLRQAINSANSNGNAGFVDTIKFAPALAGKTIKLDSSFGELQIRQSVLIQGLGANKLTVDGGGGVGGEGGSRIFDIIGGEGSPYKVTLSGITLTHGNAVGGEGSGGGAVLVQDTETGDQVSIQGCVISSNTSSDRGGAVFTDGGANLTIQNSTFTKNSAGGEGGAMYCQSAHLTIQDSTFSSNVSGNEGGAIVYSRENGNVNIARSTFAENSTEGGGGALWINDRDNTVATISRSSFYGNVAGGEGGAIGTGDEGSNTKLTIDNTTISGNTANSDDGGGIWVFGGTLTLRNDTLSQNKALHGEGGGVYTTDGATTNIVNSIVEGNHDKTGANDISFGGRPGGGPSTYNVQYSLIQAVPPDTINGINSHNIFNVSANLMPLGFYFGGTTKSQPPKPGSLAIKAGSYSLVSAFYTVDQNGKPRSADHISVDLGAVESGLSRTRRGA